MKIERVTFIWTFMSMMNFELPKMSKKWSLGFFRPNLPQLGLFHLILYVKVFKRNFNDKNGNFRSKVANIALFENKKIWKFKNPKFVNYALIIHKKGNKTCLKSNSTSFMFNIFCEMKGKKVIHWEGAGGNMGTVPITFWKCNISIYLDIQAITTLCAFYWLFMC